MTEPNWNRADVQHRIKEKVERLLINGHVHISTAGPGEVVAIVDGRNGRTYWVRQRHGDWFCPCRASWDCTHILAVQRVTRPWRERRQA